MISPTISGLNLYFWLTSLKIPIFSSSDSPSFMSLGAFSLGANGESIAKVNKKSFEFIEILFKIFSASTFTLFANPSRLSKSFFIAFIIRYGLLLNFIHSFIIFLLSSDISSISIISLISLSFHDISSCCHLICLL